MNKLTQVSLALVTVLALGSMGTSTFAKGSGTDTTRLLAKAATTSAAADDVLARRKPRVPGGSGCDTPQDRAEHPECRG